MAKIKFCGMTNLDDCKEAVNLGVDFVGFVFYKKSARAVSPDDARRIVEKLCAKVRTVGVFVEEGDGEIEEVVGYCGLDFAQVYRASAAANSIRAVRVGLKRPETPEGGLLLFDSETETIGGAGVSFDLGLLKGCDVLGRAFIAGGIGVHNVEEVLRLRPFGVDLASSIEARPGIKDRAKMKKFVEKVRAFRL